MHIDDDDIAALGYACPEWDDVCERVLEERAEAAERDRDRYQTRRLDPWYMSRCRERAQASRDRRKAATCTVTPCERPRPAQLALCFAEVG
jgi:hypothetical protein